MQTFIVHNRHPRQSLSSMGWRAFLSFEIMALGQILAPLLHSSFTLLSLIRLALGLPIFGSEGGWPLIYPVMFGLGYLAAIAQTLAGLLRLGQQRPRLLAQMLLPLYWLLVSVATIRALHELLEKPFYWAKTAHRVVTNPQPAPRKATRQSPAPIKIREPEPGE